MFFGQINEAVLPYYKLLIVVCMATRSPNNFSNKLISNIFAPSLLAFARSKCVSINIPRYVHTFEEEEPVDLGAVAKELKEIDTAMASTDAHTAVPTIAAIAQWAIGLGPDVVVLPAQNDGAIGAGYVCF